MLIGNSSIKVVKLGLCASDLFIATVANTFPVLIGGILLSGRCVAPPGWVALKPVKGDCSDSLCTNTGPVSGVTNKFIQGIADIFDLIRC